MNLSRRSVLFGLGGVIAAPAVVRSGVLMPVRAFKMPPLIGHTHIYNPFAYDDLALVIYQIEPWDTPFQGWAPSV